MGGWLNQQLAGYGHGCVHGFASTHLVTDMLGCTPQLLLCKGLLFQKDAALSTICQALAQAGLSLRIHCRNALGVSGRMGMPVPSGQQTTHTTLVVLGTFIPQQQAALYGA